MTLTQLNAEYNKEMKKFITLEKKIERLDKVGAFMSADINRCKLDVIQEKLCSLSNQIENFKK